MNSHRPDSVDHAMDEWGASARAGAQAPIGGAFAQRVLDERGARRVRNAATVTCLGLCVGGAWMVWPALRSTAVVAPEERSRMVAGHESGGVRDIDSIVLDARRPTAAMLLRINTGTSHSGWGAESGSWSLSWAAEQSPGV